MTSSTNIKITCPLLTEEQENELFDLLEGLDSYWLDRNYWNVWKNNYNGQKVAVYYVEENGVPYDTAGDLLYTVLEDFLAQYFLGEDCSVEVSYCQMNADGSYTWSAECKDGVCTFIDQEEICDNYINCPMCNEFFEIDFDIIPYDESTEETIICPNCGHEITRKGCYLYTTWVEDWKKE